jgi:hypothetical protein
MLGIFADRKARHALRQLASDDSETRCSGAESLGKLGPGGLAAVSDRKAIVDALIMAMGAQSDNVRVCSIGAVGTLRLTDQAVVRALGDRLSDPYDFARQAAAETLRWCRGDAVFILPDILKAIARERVVVPLAAMWNVWLEIAPFFASSTAVKESRLLPLFEAAWANRPPGFVLKEERYALERLRKILMLQFGRTRADLMRFASLTTESDENYEHGEILGALAKARLSSPGEIEGLLRWAELDADHWFRSYNDKDQGYLTERVTVGLIAQLGRGALPVLQDLKNKPWNTQAVMTGLVEVMIKEAIERLLR